MHGLMREGRREPVLYSTLPFIVSGDRDLLDLGRHRGIPIIDAAAAAELIARVSR